MRTQDTLIIIPTLPISSIEQIDFIENGGIPPILRTKRTDRMEGLPINASPPMEGQSLPRDFYTFDTVQERLVEAVIMLWRLPDREKGWHRGVAKDGPWDQIVAEWGDYADDDVQPATPGMTQEEMAEMEEALSWMAHVPDRDRRLVGLAIVQLARGGREVSWRRLLAPMGLALGTDGLRMRYGRAINAICVAESRTNPRADVSINRRILSDRRTPKIQ
jgi:hypothetical protein